MFSEEVISVSHGIRIRCRKHGYTQSWAVFVTWCKSCLLVLVQSSLGAEGMHSELMHFGLHRRLRTKKDIMLRNAFGWKRMKSVCCILIKFLRFPQSTSFPNLSPTARHKMSLKIQKGRFFMTATYVPSGKVVLSGENERGWTRTTRLRNHWTQCPQCPIVLASSLQNNVECFPAAVFARPTKNFLNHAVKKDFKDFCIGLGGPDWVMLVLEIPAPIWTYRLGLVFGFQKKKKTKLWWGSVKMLIESS